MFNWDEFKNRKVAVNCDTEEKAREFIKECFERGMKWSNFTESKTMFDWYKRDTCYEYKIDENRLMFTEKSYYKEQNYKIIKWESEKMKFKVGDKVVKSDGSRWINADKYKTILSSGIYNDRAKYKLSNSDVFWFDEELELYKESQTEFTFQEVVARNIPGVYENCNDDGARVKSVEINEHGSFTINADFSGLIELDLGLGINENLKFKLQESKKIATIYRVEHKKDGKKYDFISSQRLQKEMFVVCDTSQGKSYGRIVDIETRELTEEEIKQCRECWRA